MSIWQADFYRRPLRDETGQLLWELLICDITGKVIYQAFCSQLDVSHDWLVSQVEIAAAKTGLPDRIQIFRPQSLNLFEAVGQDLGIKVEATRRTPGLKRQLQQRTLEYQHHQHYTGEAYKPLDLDKPPPLPLPENLWGDRWRFASIPARDIEEAFAQRAIPISKMPHELLPLHLGLPSTLAVPGVVIDGGRQSMPLARWLQDVQPVALNYISGAPDGLILEAGLVERWVMATFEDEAVAVAGRLYEQRKQKSQGLHFLLVQPDDSGMTYTGFWLLISH